MSVAPDPPRRRPGPGLPPYNNSMQWTLGIMKTMKRSIVIAAFFSLFCGQATAGTTACVLPVADGGDVEPSPASAQGVIAKVSHVQIVLTGQKSKPIRFGKETELFTVYGGFVEAKELKVGQHVFVWFVGCKEVPGTPPIAAVIQLCSTEAEPCLK